MVLNIHREQIFYRKDGLLINFQALVLTVPMSCWQAVEGELLGLLGDALASQRQPGPRFGSISPTAFQTE